MKKLVVLLTLVAAASAFSQGQVNFNNKISASGIDAPISYAAGGPVTTANLSATMRPDVLKSIASGSLAFGGINAKAALYGAAPGVAESAFSLLTPAVPFRSASAAGYVDVSTATGGSSRTVQGVDVNQPAQLQIRAWDGGKAGVDSFEAAMALQGSQEFYAGKGNIVTISLGGGTVQAPVLTGITAFSMAYFPVPEPSIIGLGLLGAVAGMVVFRRRQ